MICGALSRLIPFSKDPQSIRIFKFEMLLNKKRYIIEISPINHGQGFFVEGKPNYNIGGANNGFF
jgi:hypothetical protein